jgi:hypothetical protein
MPWAFHASWNLDLDRQSVLYAAYHTRWFSRLSHCTIPLEQVAWLVVLYSIHPALPLPLLALVVVQAAHTGELWLALFVAAIWVALYGAMLSVIAALGLPAAYFCATTLLIGCGALRCLGHVVEPVPPLIYELTDRFLPLSRVERTPRLALITLLGYASEFASALPHRLFLVQLNWLAQWLGHRPRRSLTWEAVNRIAADIHMRGWRAYPPIARAVSRSFGLAVCDMAEETVAAPHTPHPQE